jgi:general secretion pathway protein G
MSDATLPTRNTTIPRAGARGFTLIELVIVLALIGGILAMVGPRIYQSMGRANSENAKIKMAQIGGALELYKLDNGRYPSSSEGLVALVKAPSGASNWNGPYLKDESHLKDPWTRDFKYVSPGEKAGFDLITLGADGKDGGEGENRDIHN